MARPRPKSDLVQHVWRFYSTLRTWGHARRSAHYDATWRQLAAACGYADDVHALRAMQRYAQLLDELGLARVYGVKDRRGAWQRLDVELLHAPDVKPETGPRPVYVRTLLTRRQRAILGPLRAGRRSRALVPRVFRKSAYSQGKGFDLRSNTLLLGPCVGASMRPCGGRSGVTRPSALSGAGAGAALDGRRPRSWRSVSAAPPLLASLIGAYGLDGNTAALHEAAVQAAGRGVDGTAVVAAVWRVVHGAEGLTLDDRRAGQLAAGLAALDRYAAGGRGRRGAGVAVAVERILADVADQAAGELHEQPLRTLAGVACWAWSLGRQWRRAARGAGPRRPSLGRDPHGRRGWDWPADQW
jgi:hypothetical protein